MSVSKKLPCRYRNFKRAFVLLTIFILKELSNLSASKSTGLDEIPVRFLKDGAQQLSLPITFLINLSISTGTVPNELKWVRVNPLFNKKSKLEVGNYRPVAILCILSKILERAVYTQLESYLKKTTYYMTFNLVFANISQPIFSRYKVSIYNNNMTESVNHALPLKHRRT